MSSLATYIHTLIAPQVVTVNVSRILLCKASAIVLEKSYELLNLPTVQKM